MRAAILLRRIIPLLLITYTSVTMADESVSVTQNFARRMADFAVNIYSSILLRNPNQNIIISPLSIQTCTAMARLGAENQTAMELDKGLGLSSFTEETMAEGFYQILKSYENSDVLKIANKIYVHDKYTLRSSFNEILSKKFLASAETISFTHNAAAAANQINGWVEQKTNHLIKDLVSDSDLGDDTLLLLINAIYFKGQWATKFVAGLTADEDFYLNEKDKVQVPMMHVKAKFRYAYLSHLSAAIIELPYKGDAPNSLSMLVILPDSRTGLQALEEKLLNVDINDLVANMNTETVAVALPKFKTEFSIELTEPLKQLGISRMFSDEAEFGKMIDSRTNIKVSKVIHKAFIEVNEEGTEAAAATGIHARKKRSIEPANPSFAFLAEHPFVYVVTDKKQENIYPYFMGSLKIPLVATSQLSHDEL